MTIDPDNKPTFTNPNRSDACDTIRIRHCDPLRRGACYFPYDGWIAFNSHAFNHGYLDFTGILNHECLHKVLHHEIGFQASKGLDNLWIDDIHETLGWWTSD